MSVRGILQAVAVVGRVILGMVSIVCFRLFRWLMRRIANAFFALRQGQARRWRPLGAASLRNPLAMPVFMTSAPRWNPHALLATAGPLRVQQSLTIDLAEARRSAASWSLVIYTFPGFKTVTTLDGATIDGGEPMRTVPLPPGRYWLGIRYYRWSEHPVLPAMLVDGLAVVGALPVPGDLNVFYADLARRRSAFYFLLHYYVWVLLRYAAHLPKRWVEREYLPVGNPGTRFLYGYVTKGDRIEVKMDPALLRSHDVYLTVYSRASFPRSWTAVVTDCYLGEPCISHGHYLIRVHPCGAVKGDGGAGEIEVRVVNEKDRIKV